MKKPYLHVVEHEERRATVLRSWRIKQRLLWLWRFARRVVETSGWILLVAVLLTRILGSSPTP